jgi:hypothetical protein
MPVGAGLLAMVVNDNAWVRMKCGALEIDRQQAGSYRDQPSHKVLLL